MRIPVLSCVLFVACAADPDPADSDSGGGSESSSAGSMTSTSSASSTTGVASCDEYASTPDIGPPVAVTVRHDGTAPVFFVPRGCGGALPLVVTDGAGEAIQHVLSEECSPNTCEDFLASGDCSVGCNDCAPPSAGRIEPAAMGSTAWPGRILTTLPLTADCAPAQTCPDTCVRPDQAPAGSYTLQLTVFRTCTGTCECEPGSASLCTLWSFDEELSSPATFTVAVDYPSQTAAEIVITD
jgi:hypothetical protein